MSPLNVELLRPGTTDWIKFGTQKPGELPGSLSDHKDDGSRDIYLFECEKDDGSSVIVRSKGGIDTEGGALREVISNGFEEVARVRPGESFVLKIRSGLLKENVEVRFSHVEKR